MNEQKPEFYPIVDMHSTWLVLNPIQGCPKKCKYCFLKERGLNSVKPYVLAEPKEAVELLLNSNFYIEDIPLCLFSQTDLFSTPGNIEYGKKLITLLMGKNIKNPIVFITKCKIPQDFIDFVDEYEKQGHKFVFFLSYSGLNSDMEVGVDKEIIKNNFINLSKSSKKIVHYWRPLIPENSSKETIEEVYNFVKKYSKASITIGLKTTDEIIKNIRWDKLNQNKEKATGVNNVWNKDAYEYIWKNIAKKKDEYPLFQTTACALAYALEIPERKVFFNSFTCLNNNNCPEEQRKRCMKNQENLINYSKEEIVGELIKFKKDVDPSQIEIDYENRIVKIYGVKLQLNVISCLTEKFKMKIVAPKDENDYYWNSELTNVEMLKI